MGPLPSSCRCVVPHAPHWALPQALPRPPVCAAGAGGSLALLQLGSKSLRERLPPIPGRHFCHSSPGDADPAVPAPRVISSLLLQPWCGPTARVLWLTDKSQSTGVLSTMSSPCPTQPAVTPLLSHFPSWRRSRHCRPSSRRSRTTTAWTTLTHSSPASPCS